MYRPPEICDPYQGFLVNEKCDVWMIGMENKIII